MKNYLPSKKFIKIALGALVVIFIIYMVFLYSKTYKSLKNPTITTTTVKVQDLLEKDTDGDGVKDWEEVLWGTDLNKTATFGMSDKEYVENRRKEISAKNETEGKDNTASNDTEQIAQEFLATVITLKESGNLNSFNITNLAQKFSKDIGTNANLKTSYTDSDVKTSTDTASAKKAYYASFSKALATAQKGGLGGEMSAVVSYFSANTTDATPLKKLASTYTAFTKSLLAMSVPPSAASMHLDLVNESDNMATIFKNISEINDNSIIGLIAIAQFENNEPKMEKTLAGFVSYFKTNAIIK